MIFVSRRLRQLTQTPNSKLVVKSITLESLRSVPAWVLLGEPGAGKSEAFKTEAQAVGGLYLRVAEFVYSDLDEEWKNKCLFLDGLDEVRASSTSESILFQLKSRIKKLGLPNFRLACRAADWYGQSDQEDIVGVSPNGQLPIYSLEPLTLANIKQILRTNFNRSDTQQFIAQAESHGISALLSNPQTLRLTVKALGEQAWPNSRNETYQFACKALVQEQNRRHRDQKRFHPELTDTLLEAAGQIFAILLLADKSGVSLDKSTENTQFPDFISLNIGIPEHIKLTLSTALFVPALSNDQRLEPTHRSVAEYLAANWLGKQIDKYGLSLKRVLNLMLGFDGKAVAGLRGLYGWLTLKCLKAQHWLIKNDPLTAALYSDLKPMDVEAKKMLLDEVHHQTQLNPSLFWNMQDSKNLAPLFQPELWQAYKDALQNPSRDDSTQTYVVFILQVLGQSSIQAELTEEFLNIAADGTRWERVRKQALEIWLESDISAVQAIEFLNQLNGGNTSDPDEELSGMLLNKLFPKSLSALQALNYLHLPRHDFLGLYQHFWAYLFPEKIHEEDLPNVLDELSQRSDLQSLGRDEFHISKMLDALVVRGVLAHGDHTPDSRLFEWLRIGVDQYGGRRHEPEFDKEIIEWLSARPDRYKGLLGVCFKRSETAKLPRHSLFNNMQILRGAPAPEDLGLWHFLNIDLAHNDELAREHLAKAVQSLWDDRPTFGLTFDMVVEWAGNDSKKISWLEPLLLWEIPEWRKTENNYIQKQQREQSEVRRERTVNLAIKLPEIRSGTANAALMNQLAGVWLNRFTDTRGETPLERFKTYCDNYTEIYEAVKVGLPACVYRNDLPTVEEIIDLQLKQQAHWIRAACLLGMELIWADNPAVLDSLDNTLLEKMVCFRLTEGTGSAPDWFVHLVSSKPLLVSRILITFAGRNFKAQNEYVDGIYPLARDATYKRVAVLSVPALLSSFPTRNKQGQLHQLNVLLKAAIKYSMPELPSIVAKKLKLKSLDPGQRVYFLFTGTLLDPEQYEQELWDFVGRSWQRVQHLSECLGHGMVEFPIELELSAKTYGKLIEIQTPFAELDWPIGGGLLSPAMRLGDQVRVLINKLATLGTSESLDEINRLLKTPSLEKIKNHLLNSKNEIIQRVRENTFAYPTLSDVAKILNNKSPIGPADLQAIVLDCLDQIATDIQTSNSDLFRQFWTEGMDNQHKSENSCRDALLAMLRGFLQPMGIESEPEADFVNDKRADIRISYRDKILIPIEIKGEWNPTLWTAAQNQLIPQYTTQKRTNGFGIYLVIWVGGKEQPAVRDEGQKPVTPADLEQRLFQYLSKNQQSSIAVRVINVAKP